MKVLILAGGLGTRISEETDQKPKPMVLIDDKPIIWHLMEIFSKQEMNDFVIALGYRGDVIKRWLLDMYDLNGDLEIDFSKEIRPNRSSLILNQTKVLALDTGQATQTGGRIRQCMQRLTGQRIIVVYGDGLANVSLKALIKFHESHGKLATVTAVRPPARFGHMTINSNKVESFDEKTQADSGWVNGGFFVLEPRVIDYIDSDIEPFETGALPRLAAAGELMAYMHDGFWQPMDTLREKMELSRMAKEVPPPWLAGL